MDIGIRLGKILGKGTVISLEGALGLGKTILVKGIARSLDIHEEITSPSFTIISVYKGNHTLYHIDLFRIKSEDELDYLGITDILYGEGVSVIEWGNHAAGILPRNTIRVTIKLLDNMNRQIEIKDIDI